MKTLIVEDDPVSATLIQRLLVSLGLEVERASDGASAIDAFNASSVPIRFVVADWMMPNMDGVEMVRRIRVLNKPYYTFVCMVTARHQREDRIEAFNAGIDFFMTKPLDRLELANIVRVVSRVVDAESRSAPSSSVQFYSCFLSYSSKDSDFTNRLAADLKGRDISCWYAPDDLKIGDRLRPAIDEAIRIRDKLLVVLSENSINSPWVAREVENALEEERVSKRQILFPIRLDDTVFRINDGWATDARQRHIGDFTRWQDSVAYSASLNRLLRDMASGSI